MILEEENSVLKILRVEIPAVVPAIGDRLCCLMVAPRLRFTDIFLNPPPPEANVLLKVR